MLNGSLVILDCIADGSPPPNITWLLDMVPVNLTAGSFEQLVNGSLVVVEAREDTVGFFTCVADNGVGTSWATVQVDVVVNVEDIGEGGSEGREGMCELASKEVYL